MNVVALIFLIFACSASAMDRREIQRPLSESALLGHYSQIIEKMRKDQCQLDSEIDSTLEAKSDHFVTALSLLQEKRLRHKPTPPKFDEELDQLQRSLSPHENLLAPHRQQILSEITFAHLKPLDDAVQMLNQFIMKWKETAGLYKAFRMAITIIKDYQEEWQLFTENVATNIDELPFIIKPQEPAKNPLNPSPKTLLITDIYIMLSNTFFKWPVDLKQTLDDNRQKFGEIPPAWFLTLSNIQDDLNNYFKVRGRWLWDILLNALARRGIQDKEFPTDYSQLDATFFFGDNPVKKAVTRLNDLANQANSTPPLPSDDDIGSRGGSRPSSVSGANSLASVDSISSSPVLVPPSTPKKRSGSDTAVSSPLCPPISRSAPTTPIHIRAHLPSHASLNSFSLSGSPLRSSPSLSSPFSLSRKGSDSHKPIPYELLNIELLAQDLKNIFTPIDVSSWEKSLNEISAMLLNPANIVEPLNSLLQYYSSAKTLYVQHSNVWDLLAPKATLRRTNKVASLITQPMATKACLRWRHNSLCFNCSDLMNVLKELNPDDREDDAIRGHGWERVIGNVVFKPLPIRVQCHVGATAALSILESLFGITEVDHVGFMTIRSVRYLLPRNGQTHYMHDAMKDEEHWALVERYMRDPSLWREDFTHYYLTAQPRYKEIPLLKFLENLNTGKASFDQINRHSYGMQFLFNLVTGSSRPLDQYVLVELPSGDYGLKRKGNTDIMAPFFRQITDPTQKEAAIYTYGSENSFIERNILPILGPLAHEIVPDSVKNIYIHHNIYFLLSIWLKEIGYLQQNYDVLVRQNLLEKEDEISEGFDVKISQAQRLGLTTAQRSGMLVAMIENHHALVEALSEPNVTYRKLLERVQPQQAYYACLIQDMTKRRIEFERPIAVFFSDLIPILIKQIQQGVVSIPNDLPPELKVQESDGRSSQALLCCSEHERLISGSNNAFTFDDVISKRPEKVQQFIREHYTTDVQLWAKNRRHVITFFQDVIPATLHDLQAMVSWAKKTRVQPPYTLQELEEFRILSTTLLQHAKSAYVTTFDQLVSSLDTKSKKFFTDKFDWWLSTIDGPRAEYILKAWEFMSAERAIGLDEPTLRMLCARRNNWNGRFMRTSMNQPTICQILECDSSLKQMIQEFALSADLSHMSPDLALGTINIILGLDKELTNVHASWPAVLQRGFVGLPPSLKSLAIKLGLLMQQEQETLRKEQLIRLEQYLQFRQSSSRALEMPSLIRSPARAGVSASRDFESDDEIRLTIPELTDREVRACNQLRDLLKGNATLNSDEERILLDAIIDLLVLPQASEHPTLLSNTMPSIALASCLGGKSGIFKRKAEVGGDHYLFTWSDNWLRALQSNMILPLNVRTILLSHSIIPLILQWLRLNPNIDLHPWFIEILKNKTEKLQTNLGQQLHATFDDILQIWPEIYYIIQTKSFVANATFEQKLLSFRDQIIRGQTPIESNDTQYDWLSRDKQTLQTLLDEAETLHFRYKSVPPLSCNQAATQCLKLFRPDPSQMDVLAHTLAHASHLDVIIQEIDPQYWQDDNILRGVAAYDFRGLATSPEHCVAVRTECLKLACALRLGCNQDKLSLSLINGLQVSGLHSNPSEECDDRLLETLVGLNSTVSSLDLSNNNLRSIPVVLTTLTNLTQLNISNNPIFNPSLLLKLTSLRNLVIDSTRMLDQHLLTLIQLINRGVQDIKILETLIEESQRQQLKQKKVTPLTSDQAATFFLRLSRPYTTPTDILAHTLIHATNFTICIEEIDSQHWQHDNIFRGLAAFNFRILTQVSSQALDTKEACFKLACALRLGHPINNLTLTLSNGLRISGFHLLPSRESNMDLLSALIGSDPTIQALDLSNNNLHVFPLTTCSLTNLTHLNLSDNPGLHNPAPLIKLTSLTSLNLSGTSIPPVPLSNLRSLVSGNTRLQRLPLVSDYVNKPSAEISNVEEILSTGGGTDRLLNQVAGLIKNKDTYRNLIVYILERLADLRWDHVLSYGDISCGTVPVPYPTLDHYIQVLTSLLNPPCEPRSSIRKLLFAIAHQLPVGTNPSSLLFQGNSGSVPNVTMSSPLLQPIATNTFDPACLLRIEVSGQRIGNPFFEIFLPKCINLETLYLFRCQQSNILQLLPRLPNLRFLDISRNQISSLMDLKTSTTDNKFDNLECLYLSHNNLLSGSKPAYNGLIYLLEIQNLKILYLDNNKLTVLPPFDIRRFKEIDLRNNMIKDLQGLQNIEEKTQKLLVTPQFEPDSLPPGSK